MLCRANIDISGNAGQERLQVRESRNRVAFSVCVLELLRSRLTYRASVL